MPVTHTYLPSFFFFFNDTATTEIYTLSLHDALPISGQNDRAWLLVWAGRCEGQGSSRYRSEEHTSELQSQSNLVCRLLLEKKKTHRRTSYLWQSSTTPTQHTRSPHYTRCSSSRTSQR